jgi:uncharacterized protein YjbK
MTTPSREIEFKFAVHGKQAFNLLLRQLDLPASLLDHGIKQTNHFFDSASQCLHKNHIAVRLREEGNKNILTIKAGKRSDKAVTKLLTNRIEEEVLITGEISRALLTGKLSPQQVIEQQFNEKSLSILQQVNSACGEETLKLVGYFINVRIHLPPIKLPAGGSNETIVFELDTSTFADGRVEYEFEIEITEQSDAAAIEADLLRLFKQAGIEWHTAASKAERFYKAITS